MALEKPAPVIWYAEDEEFAALVRQAVHVVAGRVPVIVGTGTANTRKTVRATRRARELGADAALVVTPYYVRPTQEGLRRHFLEVGAEGGLPVILYNVPGRTGVDLLPETVAQLAGRPDIVGIKEARPELERMQALVALKAQAPGFAVLSGDDPSAARSLLAGADGLISVANNIAPAALRRLCDAAHAGRADEARALDGRLQPLFDAIGLESNPIPVKWGLSLLGICEPHLRLPLTSLSEGHRERVRQVVDGADRMAA